MDSEFELYIAGKCPDVSFEPIRPSWTSYIMYDTVRAHIGGTVGHSTLSEHLSLSVRVSRQSQRQFRKQ